MQTESSSETALLIGELCIDADRACARGDLPVLAGIAIQLSRLLPEPLHCELAALVDLCQCKHAHRATETWSSLKNRVYRSTA